MQSAATVGPGPVASVRWGAWVADRDLSLSFPADRTVRSCPPTDAPDMTAGEIASAVRHPTGTPRLSEIAAGFARPCIVIDDLTRPTRGDLLIPPILDELALAGIAADDVLIVAGVANHRPMLRDDLERKLGAGPLATCQVLNHFSGRHRPDTEARGRHGRRRAGRQRGLRRPLVVRPRHAARSAAGDAAQKPVT